MKRLELESEHKLLLEHIAKIIVRARKKKGLKQTSFSEYGYSERMMVKLESGTNSPTLKTLLKLSIILEIPLQKFFPIKK